MSNVTIFKQQGAVASSRPRELSDLAKSLLTRSSGGTSRRIQTNTNGTFKRVVNGEQIGNAVRGEINVVIVAVLPSVSRVYYAEKFDPNKEATLPNCWSNLGDKPEAAAADVQHTNCAACPQNIKGSGDNGGRACRYQRRIAVLLAEDTSGDVYQFNIPAKSLFGKGVGNTHPFESYKNFLGANGESIDGVVTTISYDLNADTMELQFSPLRGTTDEEQDRVKLAQSQPEAKRYTMITVAGADGVTKPAVVAKPVTQKIVRSEEPDYEPVTDEPVTDEPVKRAKKTAGAPAKPVPTLADAIKEWGED